MLNQLGRVLFLKRQFKEAVEAFKRVLTIDPEDLQAHYNLMLSYRGMGDGAGAERERVLYERFKADESAQSITGPYRQLHPDDNNERQADPRARRDAGIRIARVTLASRRRVETMNGLARAALSLCGAGLAVALVQAGQAQPPASIQFTDVTTPAGLNVRHHSGAFGKKYLPETMGSGVAFLDVDGDGWQDMLFVQSMNWPGHAGVKSFPALYRNNRNGTFTDITRAAGLAIEMYGLGVSAADYDNDGKVDIYITALGQNHLFRNLGGGRFDDVTAKAGVADRRILDERGLVRL